MNETLPGLTHLYVPITRIDEDERIVEGICFANEVVDGEGGIRVRRSAMEAATPDYLKWGAVREMHQPSAVGTATAPGCGIEWGPGGATLRALIVDDAAWRKVKAGVYKGFSIGIVPRLMRGKDVEQLGWPETSLVDRPKDPGAKITLYRAADSELPPVETEPNPAPEDEELELPELFEEGEPEEEDETEDEETEDPAQELGKRIAAFVTDLVTSTLSRAQTSETVPSRENLEGKRLHGNMHYDCGAKDCHSHKQQAAAQRCAETDMTRLEEVPATLATTEADPVLTRLEQIETRLATLAGENATLRSENATQAAEIQRLANEPAPAKSPVRYPGAYQRTFAANGEAGDPASERARIEAEMAAIEAQGKTAAAADRNALFDRYQILKQQRDTLPAGG